MAYYLSFSGEKKFLGIIWTYFWSTERSHFNTRSYGENRAVRIPCVGTVYIFYRLGMHTHRETGPSS